MWNTWRGINFHLDPNEHVIMALMYERVWWKKIFKPYIFHCVAEKLKEKCLLDNWCPFEIRGYYKRAQIVQQTFFFFTRCHLVTYKNPRNAFRKHALFINYIFLKIVKACIVLNTDYKHRVEQELVKELQDYVKSQTAPYKYPRKVSAKYQHFVNKPFS